MILRETKELDFDCKYYQNDIYCSKMPFTEIVNILIHFHVQEKI